MRSLLLWLLLSVGLSRPALADDCADLVAAFDNAAAVTCLEALVASGPGLELDLRLARALVDAGEDSEGAVAEEWRSNYHRAVRLRRQLEEVEDELVALALAKRRIKIRIDHILLHFKAGAKPH